MRLSSLAALAALVTLSTAYAQTPATAPAAEKGKWVNISDTLVAKLEADGQKAPWPGKSAGLTVDPASAEVYMVVAGLGIYKSADHGNTWARADGKAIGGRAETGAALQFDPNGKRLACFMLDGTAGMTLDAGKTWTSFAGVGRNWDYAAVDWTAEKPVNIFAMHHESGGEIYLSHDAGKKWTMIGKDKDYNAMGIFDANTLILSKNKGGISRSTDAGKTWTQVSDLTPTTHVMVNYKNTAYLVGSQGLLVSTDQGLTWKARGGAINATFGPIFDTEKHFIVWNGKGISETTDAGETWKQVMAFPKEYAAYNPQWYNNVGWDPKADIFYCSQMGHPAFRWER